MGQERMALFTAFYSIFDIGDTTIDYEYYNTPSDHARHGKLKSVTEADGTSIEAVTQFEYGVRGNLSKITDPAGRVTLQYHDNHQARGHSTLVGGPVH